MKKPTPKKQDPDYLFAFSCALNLGLYAADPGPQIVIVRNSDEQRTITPAGTLCRPLLANAAAAAA
jgi:hypothetical protein